MGFPAARISDMHTCPMCMGVPAPIVWKGAYTVLTGKMPQARVTDMCVCVGPPPPMGGDPIVTGAWNVLVEKMPAARMTDLTLKGGAIVTGFPTVLIGMSGASGGGGGAGAGAGGAAGAAAGAGPGPVGTTNVGPAIKVEGTEAFREKTVAALAKIAQTPSGAKMLNDLHKSGKTITIKETGGGNEVDGFTNAGTVDSSGNPGSGSDSTVHYNPNTTSLGSSDTWMTRPPEVGLAHEMIHAKHAAYGEIDVTEVDNDNQPDPSDPTKKSQIIKEEVKTAGIPPYDNEPYSENSIRDEWDPQQPQRTYY
ncbi:M91 family zinc metallopeptidase [Roseibium marinum]|uniref:Putative Zn-binding protein involved in type VI secretion n=1 Tax=Roseibium marinum TaxID=281252 RepID=A0A2S3UQ41_9HYPH|nr:M91 family zinc metallopeptidase [Roseibium marinum]POF29700.1 putative Zn-binding protein involved in type VI secretion [Roseibium marinum]